MAGAATFSALAMWATCVKTLLLKLADRPMLLSTGDAMGSQDSDSRQVRTNPVPTVQYTVEEVVVAVAVAVAQ